MDAAGQPLSQLAEGRCNATLEQVARCRVRCELCSGQRQREQQRDQTLLRPIMEVALEPAPFGVRGMYEAGTRRTQILDTRPKTA